VAEVKDWDLRMMSVTEPTIEAASSSGLLLA
jgi:hypothetical protein